jgi:DNA (cytosine-5)-methyltransferase 1
MVKIGDGLACPPMLVPSGGTWRDDATSVDNPLPARTTRENDALLCPPFVITLRRHAAPAGVDMPVASVTAGGNHHGLTVPPGAMAQATELTFPTLVIPYRKGSKAHRTDQPVSALTTREQHGLLRSAISIDECRYRMLRPREQLRAQRFPDSYRVLGNVSEQTMQAGNAVSANVAQWLGEACVSVL